MECDGKGKEGTEGRYARLPRQLHVAKKKAASNLKGEQYLDPFRCLDLEVEYTPSQLSQVLDRLANAFSRDGDPSSSGTAESPTVITP